MFELALIACISAGASGGQVKTAPSPDRLVKVEVRDEVLPPTVPEDYRRVKRTDLLIDRINFGLQYAKPLAAAHGDPDKDFSRFPACYFHPAGPAGIVLRRFDWFPGKPNTYAADARLPAALVGQALGGSGAALVALWSEPPLAVLGMDGGNLAGYARPCQTWHFVERIPRVYELSVPPRDKPATFTFIHDAQKRGAWLTVDQGELRLTLEKKDIRGFYHAMFIQPHKDGERTIQKELFTKEGMARCMDALVEDGVLCYHTSSRYFDLPMLIADCADTLGYAVRCGRDMANYGADGRGRDQVWHWTSEWVVVARKAEYLRHLRPPAGYQALPGDPFPYWSDERPSGRYRWTDDGPKSMRGMVRCDPVVGSFAHRLWELKDVLTKVGVSPQQANSAIWFAQDMLNTWGAWLARGRDY
jgi:hypothetical protein